MVQLSRQPVACAALQQHIVPPGAACTALHCPCEAAWVLFHGNSCLAGPSWPEAAMPLGKPQAGPMHGSSMWSTGMCHHASLLLFLMQLVRVVVQHTDVCTAVLLADRRCGQDGCRRKEPAREEVRRQEVGGCKCCSAPSKGHVTSIDAVLASWLWSVSQLASMQPRSGNTNQNGAGQPLAFPAWPGNQGAADTGSHDAAGAEGAMYERQFPAAVTT